MSSTALKKRSESSFKPFVPRPFQKECIRFGLTRPAAGFFLAPGLGKTMITLSIFRILKERGLVDELVVLGKKNIIQEVWPSEIKKWRLDFRYRVLHGGRKNARIQQQSDVWLLNYEGLKWFGSKQNRPFFKRKKRIMLVCDESSKIKNPSSKRFRLLRKMLDKFHRRYILTGSPVPNSLMDIFSQVYALDKGEALGAYITAFRNQYFYPTGFMSYEWKLQEGAEQKIFKKLKPLIIRYGTDQLDLPPLTFVDRRVELPSVARAKYAQMEADFVAMFNRHEVTAANAAVVSGKLRQIANGGLYLDRVYDEDGKPVGPRRYVRIHDAKNEALLDLVEELSGEPALVFYEFNHDLARLRRLFPKAPAFNRGLDGRDLKQLVKDWNAGKHKVAFAHTGYAAHGLNLQESGGIVVFYALDWNLENHEQAIARVWRQGQKRRVIVYRIIADDTVDEVIMAALQRKDRDQQSLLNAMEQRYGSKE